MPNDYDRRYVLTRIAAATIFLCIAAGVLWFSRCNSTRPTKQMAFDEEIEAVRKKYEPLRGIHGEIRKNEGEQSAEEFYQKEIAAPQAAELNEVRVRHGKQPIYGKENTIDRRD